MNGSLRPRVMIGRMSSLPRPWQVSRFRPRRRSPSRLRFRRAHRPRLTTWSTATDTSSVSRPARSTRRCTPNMATKTTKTTTITNTTRHPHSLATSASVPTAVIGGLALAYLAKPSSSPSFDKISEMLGKLDQEGRQDRVITMGMPAPPGGVRSASRSDTTASSSMDAVHPATSVGLPSASGPPPGLPEPLGYG